jgi:adenylosuccinate synthase
MKTSIVLGLGFGDEGKGLTTAYLASQNRRSLVVRFSGGHQAGHTVVKDGFRHVFSQFGSGTLHGAATYWSRYCTFDPVGFMNEHLVLANGGISPEVYIDRLSPVTTFYDIFYNKALEKYNRHGSVGVGFAATLERHEGPVKIFVQDLLYPQILKRKLKEVKGWYNEKLKRSTPGVTNIYEGFHELSAMELFLKSAAEVAENINIVDEGEFVRWWSHVAYPDGQIIFEGSQGAMLDMDHGLFPNVTRSSTTAKNAMRMVAACGLYVPQPEIWYVTRAYTTRHGNGWMPNDRIDDPDMDIKADPQETNVKNEWQGSFRRSMLDIDTLNYGVQINRAYAPNLKSNLVITCMDHVEKLRVTRGGKVHEINELPDMISLLDFAPEMVYVSRSSDSANITRAALDLSHAVD